MNGDRVLELEDVHNFRDYGGYPVAGGGRVKRGTLWRSAEHGGASDDDLAAIGALQLATVVDLRGDSERAANPCRRPAGFAAEVLTHQGETAALALHVEAAGGAVSAARARQAMETLYAEIGFRETLVPMLRRYFAVLASRDGASLVHCVAGKDRTGFAVAMMQSALGVHRDDIMQDYLLTNTAGNVERRIGALVGKQTERFGTMDEDTVRMLLGVQAEYLETALAAVEARCGTVECYQVSVLGVDGAMRAALRQRYLES